MSHYRWPTASLFIVNVCSPPTFEQSLYFGRNPPRIMQDEFPQHSCFGVTKASKRANFTTGGLINRWKHHNSLCKNKNKHSMDSYVMVYKAMSRVTLPRMRELCPAPTLVA
jgi:hypothetical protein